MGVGLRLHRIWRRGTGNTIETTIGYTPHMDTTDTHPKPRWPAAWLSVCLAAALSGCAPTREALVQMAELNGYYGGPAPIPGNLEP